MFQFYVINLVTVPYPKALVLVIDACDSRKRNECVAIFGIYRFVNEAGMLVNI